MSDRVLGSGVDFLERRAHVCDEKSMAGCQGYAYCAYTNVGAAPFSPIMARRRRLASVSVWRPDPQTYADMTWPPATNVPAGATPAQRLYVENCAFCHGPDGRGNGASAPSMIPRPRDFTEGLFKYKSTPEGTPPSDDDLIAVVTNGLNASGMPYFRGTLSEQGIRDVPASLMGRANPRILKRADAISSMPKCASFATLEIDRPLIYRDDRYLAGGMRGGVYPQGVFISRNLTSDPSTRPRPLERRRSRLRYSRRAVQGRPGAQSLGMPWAFFHNLTPDDAQAMARYLKTLPAAHNEIPPPLHYGVVETIAAKFWLGDPLLGQAPRLTYDL